MRKKINYKGVTASSSDYDAPDGELAAAMGVVPEDGALKPVPDPHVVKPLQEGERVLFVHRTPLFSHLISIISTRVVWAEEANSSYGDVRTLLPDETLISVNAVGNTLMLFTSKGIRYHLWKEKEKQYLNLGSHMPECPVSFGLKGHTCRRLNEDNTDTSFTISFDAIPREEINRDFSEANRNRITGQVLARVNKFIREKSVDKGRFMYPFFVRYAYRLYDSSLVMHSAPVLMMPSTQCNPIVLWDRRTSEGGAYTSADLRLFGVTASLDYCMLPSADYNEITKWKDIIKSVDIFISAPIYTYNQAGMCTSFRGSNYFDSRFVGLFHSSDESMRGSGGREPNRDTPQNPNYANMHRYYQEWAFKKLYAYLMGGSYPSTCMEIPRFTDEQIAQKVKNCYTFYFLKSIRIEDLSRERTDIAVDKDYLQSLVTREVMTDEYQSHDTLIPSISYAYNSRITLASLSRRLFAGFEMPAMVCYQNGVMDYFSVSSGGSITETTEDRSEPSYYDTYTRVDEGGDILSVYRPNTNTRICRAGHYLYYPNPGGLDIESSTWKAKLEPHVGLHGSFYFDGFKLPPEAPQHHIVSADSVSMPNKLYTSEVNNPFYFPLSGIKTVGMGEILGIQAAVKAPSPGQFGKFPLYAFCTDGTWSLEVKPDGTFYPGQLATLDVCINPKSITAMESSVLFATSRGIMMLSGSDSQCITDVLDGDVPQMQSLPHLDKLLVAGRFTLGSCTYIPFRQYITDCRICYDYPGQHVILFNPSQPYAYIFSLKSRQWGIMQSGFSEPVDSSYPNCYVQSAGQTLVDLSVPGEITRVDMFYVTRPFKFDYPDEYKQISCLLHRGIIDRHHVRCALYGSRDLKRWYLVGSSTDSRLHGFITNPHKYFCLAAVAYMTQGESISGCEVEYNLRQTNRMR